MTGTKRGFLHNGSFSAMFSVLMLKKRDSDKRADNNGIAPRPILSTDEGGNLVIDIRLDQFKELCSVGGAVNFTVKEDGKSVLLVRRSKDTFTALSYRGTHTANRVKRSYNHSVFYSRYKAVRSFTRDTKSTALTAPLFRLKTIYRQKQETVIIAYKS